MGADVERHYGSPQDIEWAVKDDEVYLLQTRPITTLEERLDDDGGGESKGGGSDGGSDGGAAAGKLLGCLTHGASGTGGKRGQLDEFDTRVRDDDWLTTCNAGEMFPGAGTPLTISVWGTAVEKSMQGLQLCFGTQSKYNPDSLKMAWRHGHIFINMTNFLAFTCHMPGSEMGKENGEMSILGRLNPGLTHKHLTDLHGESNPVKKLLNGARWFRTIVFTELFIVRRMRRRLARIKRMLQGIGEGGGGGGVGPTNAGGKWTSSETAKTKTKAKAVGGRGGGDRQKRRSEVLFETIHGTIPHLEQQWADGVRAGSTSAVYMLLVMKLTAKGNGEMWQLEQVC
jgi:hypothetical protein